MLLPRRTCSVNCTKWRGLHLIVTCVLRKLWQNIGRYVIALSSSVFWYFFSHCAKIPATEIGTRTLIYRRHSDLWQSDWGWVVTISFRFIALCYIILHKHGILHPNTTLKYLKFSAMLDDGSLNRNMQHWMTTIKVYCRKKYVLTFKDETVSSSFKGLDRTVL